MRDFGAELMQDGLAAARRMLETGDYSRQPVVVIKPADLSAIGTAVSAVPLEQLFVRTAFRHGISRVLQGIARCPGNVRPG